MDYSAIMGQVLVIVAILTAVVNIITEVMKNAFKLSGSKVINVFVLVVSEALTILVFLAYWQIKQMAIAWYIVAAFIVIGFLVAYAAMFGYDKLMKHFGKGTGE